jgi:hypothetical protein
MTQGHELDAVDDAQGNRDESPGNLVSLGRGAAHQCDSSPVEYFAAGTEMIAGHLQRTLAINSAIEAAFGSTVSR